MSFKFQGKKLTTKILSLILAIVMVVCSAPVTSLADVSEGYNTVNNSNALVVQKNNFYSGDFGGYLDVCLVKKYTSENENINDGQRLNGSSFALASGEYITVKLPAKMTYLDGRQFDIYLKFTTHKDIGYGSWAFNQLSGRYNGEKQYILNTPNGTGGMDITIEAWAETSGEVVDDASIGLALSYISTTSGARPYSFDKSIYTRFLEKSMITYDSVDSAWYSSSKEYNYAVEYGKNAFYAYSLDANHHTKIDYVQKQHGDILHACTFSVGYYKSTVAVKDAVNNSDYGTFQVGDGVLLGETRGNSIRACVDSGAKWTADKDIVLANYGGSGEQEITIPMGEEIPASRIKDIVVEGDFTLFVKSKYQQVAAGAEKVEKTNFVGLANSSSASSSTIIPSMTSVTYGTGNESTTLDLSGTLNGKAFGMNAGDYVTIKLDGKYEYPNGKSYDVYLKLTAKSRLVPYGSRTWAVGTVNSNKNIYINFPINTGADMQYEFWLQDGDERVSEVAPAIAFNHITPRVGVRAYNDSNTLYYCGFSKNEINEIIYTNDKAWYNSGSVYYFWNRDGGKRAIIGYATGDNDTVKLGYNQQDYIDANGGSFIIGYLSANVTLENDDSSKSTSISTCEGISLGSKNAENAKKRLNNIVTAGWKANMDVELANDEIVAKGDIIPDARLDEVVIKDGLVLTSVLHDHHYKYTLHNETIIAACQSKIEGEQDLVLTLDVKDRVYTAKPYAGATTNNDIIKFDRITGTSVEFKYYLYDGITPTYQGAANEGQAPTEVGKYYVKLIVGDLSITKVFVINNLYNIPTITVEVADESVNEGYTPTNIRNGGFDYHPQIGPQSNLESHPDYDVYNESNRYDYITHKASSQGAYAGTLKYGRKTPSWCTTETQTHTAHGNVSGTYFEWINNYFRYIQHNDYIIGLRESNGNKWNQAETNSTVDINPFVELNANNPASLYQDLTTTPGDIIIWGLEHAGRSIGYDNKMEVTMGAIERDPTGPNDLGLDSSKPITTFNANGITENTANRYGYDKAVDGKSSIANLTVKSATYWQEVEGLYIVPNTTNGERFTTRFSFVSKTFENLSCGNYLDNVVFDTLIGNVKSHWNKDGTVTITGYYGKIDGYPTSFDYAIPNENGEVVAHTKFDLADIPKGPFQVTINTTALLDKDVDLDHSTIIPDGYYEEVEGVEPPPVHVHDWEGGHGWDYDSKEDVITAQCSKDICSEFPTVIKLQVTSKDKEYDGKPYDHDLQPAIEKFKKEIKDNANNIEIFVEYVEVDENGNEIGDRTTTPPTDAGSYKVIVSLHEKDNGNIVSAENFFDIYRDDWYVKFESNNGLAKDYVFKRYTNSNSVKQFTEIPELSDPDAYIFNGWYYEHRDDINLNHNKDNFNPIVNTIYALQNKFLETYSGHHTNYAEWEAIRLMDKDWDDEKEFDGKYKTFGLQGVQIRPEGLYDANFGNSKQPGGLRFVASFDEGLYQHLIELYGESVEYGFVVASEKNAKNYADYYGVDYKDYRIKYKTKVAKADRNADNDMSYVTNAVCTSGTSEVKLDHRSFNKYRLFTTVIHYGENDEAKDLNIVARAYIKYTDANGVERIFYNDYDGSETASLFGGCSVSYNTVYNALYGNN